MDCCICSPTIAIYRPPRNTICPSCYERAKSMIEFLKENDASRDREAANTSDHQTSHSPRPKASMGISDAFKRMKELKEKEEGMRERLGFADGLGAAFRDGLHTDILVQPASGPPIPAHRAVLATRSEIFRTVLSTDECKAPAGDTISIPELSHQELECLLEFIYCGALKPDDRADRHACSLLVAADKYDIPFLRTFCESRILRSLGPTTALQALEASEACSNTRLKEHAMSYIVKHTDDVVLSAAYDAFAVRNAHLCVEITRALLTEMKAKRGDSFVNAF